MKSALISEYTEMLSQPISKNFLKEIIERIENNPAEFNTVYSLLFSPNPKVAWRATWAVEKISQSYPQWFTANMINEISNLSVTLKHDGQNRLCLSILLNLPVQQPISVDFLNRCYDCMLSEKFAVAVQVLSMKHIYRISKIEPDLRSELMLTLQNMDTSNYSIAFTTARKNILKLLKA